MGISRQNLAFYMGISRHKKSVEILMQKLFLGFTFDQNFFYTLKCFNIIGRNIRI